MEMAIYFYQGLKNKQKTKKEVQQTKKALKTLDYKELSVCSGIAKIRSALVTGDVMLKKRQ